MSLGASTAASPAAQGKKLKVSDFTGQAEGILRVILSHVLLRSEQDCAPKQLATKLMEAAQCVQQNDELKQQLEMNQQRVRVGWRYAELRIDHVC